MPVEKQVVSIWAGTNGILDDIDLLKIKDFEKHLLDYVDRHNPEIFKKSWKTSSYRRKLRKN